MPEINDDIQDTIEKIGESMQTIDDNFDETIENIESFLTKGKSYQRGKRYWRKDVSIGSNIGWVNTRTGVYAPKWASGKTYQAGDIVVPNSDVGYYFECVMSGTSGTVEPTFDVGGSITFDLQGVQQWKPNFQYKVGDLVVQTDGYKLHYYRCTTAGTSGNNEPQWVHVEGAVVQSGTTAFRTYSTVQWKVKGVSCYFVPFGIVG